jgi:hypothetical protein
MAWDYPLPLPNVKGQRMVLHADWTALSGQLTYRVFI